MATTFAKNQVLYGFYNHEVYDADQASRQSGATFSEDPLNDWTDIQDTVDTFGVGQMFEIVADKLKFDLSGSYSKAAGSSFLFSPPGGTPNTAVNYDLPLDSTTWWTVQANFRWKLMKSLSMILGYWYEQYKQRDWAQDGVAPDTVHNLLTMGALAPDYNVNVFRIAAKYRF